MKLVYTCTWIVSLTIVMQIFVNLIITFGIKIWPIADNYPTIQKPDFSDNYFDRFSVAQFASSIKPNTFDGTNFVSWRERMVLWLTTMGIMDVAQGKPEQCTSEQGSAFEVKDNLFRGCILGVIAPHLINPLLKKKSGKEMWDALDAQYGVSDAGSELYLMEQFLDYRMVEDRPMVKQANELHVLAKDLGCCNKENPCVLPDKFVAGGIISKLPPSWRDFATSLKHRRQEFTIDGLIGT
ncbi:hypothetical protein FA727_23550, partial [Robertmurraya kyonggiensis]